MDPCSWLAVGCFLGGFWCAQPCLPKKDEGPKAEAPRAEVPPPAQAPAAAPKPAPTAVARIYARIAAGETDVRALLDEEVGVGWARSPEKVEIFRLLAARDEGVRRFLSEAGPFRPEIEWPTGERDDELAASVLSDVVEAARRAELPVAMQGQGWRIVQDVKVAELSLPSGLAQTGMKSWDVGGRLRLLTPEGDVRGQWLHSTTGLGVSRRDGVRDALAAQRRQGRFGAGIVERVIGYILVEAERRAL